MSRPRLSVPNGNTEEGGFSRCNRCEALASPGCGASHGPANATTTIASTIKEPASAGRSRANFFRASMSQLFPEARVEPAVHQIDQDVDERVDDPDQQCR